MPPRVSRMSGAAESCHCSHFRDLVAGGFLELGTYTAMSYSTRVVIGPLISSSEQLTFDSVHSILAAVESSSDDRVYHSSLIHELLFSRATNSIAVQDVNCLLLERNTYPPRLLSFHTVEMAVEGILRMELPKFSLSNICLGFLSWVCCQPSTESTCASRLTKRFISSRYTGFGKSCTICI